MVNDRAEAMNGDKTSQRDDTSAYSHATSTAASEDDFSWTGAPETDAKFLSRLVFFWIRPLFRRAAFLHKKGKALQHEDLLPLPEMDFGSHVGPTFEEAWAKNQKQDYGNSKTKLLSKSLWAVVGKRLLAAGFIKVINTCLQFAFPLLLNAILKFIEDTQAGVIDENDSWGVRNRGYWLSVILFCAMAFKAITENMYFHKVYRAGYQARIAVSVAVYDKALRLASAERQGTTLGELVNLMQVDATKIEMFIPQIHVLWDGLLQICGYMTILYTLIGWPCFAGLAVLVCAAPVQAKIMGRLLGLNRSMITYTDARVKTTNEALQGVRCVKMYTWEDSFQQTISGSRDLELGFIKSSSYLRGFSRAYMEALPGIVAVTSFIVYAVAYPGATIKASTLFAALSAFDQLRFPLLFYPMALAQLAQAQVSAFRIESFLRGREVGSAGDSVGGGLYSNQDKECAEGEITAQDASIYWSDPSVPIESNKDDEDTSDKKSKTDADDKSEAEKTAMEDSAEELELEAPVKSYPKPILKNVNLKVSQGELCAVVGRVGSGKSTLCSAILNETVLGSGKIGLRGNIAYAAQSPWILNASLQDNILFGLPMDREKYDRVIEACQLAHDLSLLDDGDLTEIGEKGINLSGGQKQRVSVARAAYSDADIIILDDPLSALDPEVGMKLFDECIVKLMKGRTRLLVTNQLQCLRFCDTVVALGEGEVIEQGAFTDLTKTEGGEVQRLLNDLKSAGGGGGTAAKGTVEEGKEDGEGDKKEAPVAENENAPKENAGLVTKEERNIGAVSFQIYKKYFLAGGGYLRFALVYFGFIMCAANGLMNSTWVTLWTADANYERHPQGFYLGLYGLTAVTLGFFTFSRSFLLARFGVRASGSLHKNLLSSVLHAPMSFFDTTPTGRILSRFSKDLYSIDQELTQFMDFFLFASLTVCVAIGTILFVTPWFGIAILPIFFIYFKVLNYFREVSRETKRLESISRSPVYAQFSETLGGLATIRAYGQPARFIDDFEGKIDQNIRAYYCNKSADRWLSVRLESVGALIAGLAAVFSTQVAISGAASGQSSDSNFASLAGLSLTYAISITGALQWCVRSFAQFEAAMNACERVLYYTEDIPQEAPSTSGELEAHAASSSPTASDPSAYAVVAAGGKAAETGPEWPAKGEISLNKLFMRYREETPLVLKGLNVSIAGGARIGVVGRTGSGKSSLLLSLLRMVEPSLTEQTGDYEAPITIDGVDILRIGLYDLRSKLGIIPQNPVLFSGSIRTNIDPFNQYSDDQIWSALERCGMAAAVEAMPDQLIAPVAEYGDNLSQGQRQLLCLGRALLKQCRVLLLDEATSSVDFETDREIQRTLREAFPGSTVLTIAHRVNTIMDSDKILVMKDGRAEEFASSNELLGNENSIFSQIVRHAEAEGH